MIEELARRYYTGDDGAPLFVIEYRYVFTSQGEAGVRRHRGAAWMTLLDGEPVRYIDKRTFEVIATGELVAHDLRRCNCTPAAGVAIGHRHA